MCIRDRLGAVPVHAGGGVGAADVGGALGTGECAGAVSSGGGDLGG